MNLYSNRARNFVKQLVAGASAHFLTLSRDRATLGAIFTTTTRNLRACDVIMKIVYWEYAAGEKKRDTSCEHTRPSVGGLPMQATPFHFRTENRSNVK